MRAIRFKYFGDPSVLELAEARSAVERDRLVRVKAASINPSDVKNVAGAMKQTTLPRIPGRDYAGVVEAGPAEWIGAAVWGTGGDTGFTRDGTHAEMIAVPVASLRRNPETLSFDQAASSGLTTWPPGAVSKRPALRPERPFSCCAGGGVGGAAAQIAQRLAPASSAPTGAHRTRTRRLLALAENLILGAQDLPAEIRAATGGKGADVVFDLVGGVMFRTAVDCLALGGRLVEISATGQREVSFDLADFYHNESRLYRHRHAEARPHRVGPGAGGADPRLPRRRLSCGTDRRDFRAGPSPGGLSQGRRRHRRPHPAAAAGIGDGFVSVRCRQCFEQLRYVFGRLHHSQDRLDFPVGSDQGGGPLADLTALGPRPGCFHHRLI